MVQWSNLGYRSTMALREAVYADLTGLGYIILWNVSSWQTDSISAWEIGNMSTADRHDNHTTTTRHQQQGQQGQQLRLKRAEV